MVACPHPSVSPSLLSPRFPLCLKPLTHASRGRGRAAQLQCNPWRVAGTAAASLPHPPFCSPPWRQESATSPPASGAWPSSGSALAGSWPEGLGVGVNLPLGGTYAVPKGNKVQLCPPRGLAVTPGWLAALQLASRIPACILGPVFMPRVMRGPIPSAGSGDVD